MKTYNGNLTDDIFDALDIAKKAHSLLPPLPQDIKPVHIRVLSAIYRIRDEAGNARVTDISMALGLLLPNATKVMNELVRLGIVEKSTLTTDKRVVLVHTTDLGEQYIQKYIFNYHTRLQEEFAMIGESDCITMIETITKVYQTMKKIYQKEN